VEMMDEEDLDVIDSAPNFDRIFVPADRKSASSKEEDEDDEDESETLRLTYFTQSDLDASSCPLILETLELDVMMPPQSRMIQAPALTFIVRDGGPKGAMMCSATVNLLNHADAIYDARAVDISDLVVILPEFMKQYEMHLRPKDGKEGFGGELLRRIMSKPRPVIQSGLKPSTSIDQSNGGDGGGYLVLDVRVLNKVLMDEITDDDINTIEQEAKLDQKFKIRNDDDADEDEQVGTTMSQLWPSEIKTKESQQIDHGFVVREEWEREKSFFPKLWFNAVTPPLSPSYTHTSHLYLFVSLHLTHSTHFKTHSTHTHTQQVQEEDALLDKQEVREVSS